MNSQLQTSIDTEEQLVAELARLGVDYLSRTNAVIFSYEHSPDQLLAGLVCQPSSRVRAASISLLLAQPDYSRHVHRALKQLNTGQAQTLRLFYTAAVILQEKYAQVLQGYLSEGWRKLPDLFSNDLGLAGDSPAERLRNLARLHAQWSGEYLNWEGTYESAVKNLMRRWAREKSWKA